MVPKIGPGIGLGAIGLVHLVLEQYSRIIQSFEVALETLTRACAIKTFWTLNAVVPAFIHTGTGTGGLCFLELKDRRCNITTSINELLLLLSFF